MTDLPLTGGCLCGGVRYEVTETPPVAGYCHCTRCQRRTGSAAAVSAILVPGTLRITAGEELLGSFDPPDGWSKVFCSACGGALWAQSRDDPRLVAVRMGTFDADPGIRPSYRQFTAYAAPWEPIPDDGLPRYAERRPLS
ncbi:MAG: GFA family protein [Verrucomicrobiota bacterium]